MANFEALFEDEDNIFGGTPESKYHDIANQANDEIVKDELNKIVEKFAVMETLLAKEFGDDKIDSMIKNYAFENSSEIETKKKSLFIEFTGNIVMRLDS
jgi:hypothetical protein